MNKPKDTNKENNTLKQPDAVQGASLTPLMQQYSEIKAQYPGAILFFRLGDFYEMFGDDAIKASPILEVVLTKRQNVPMCGVPYHAVNAYVKKLIKSGEKVAVCEQLEEPAPGRGIVKRGVVRVITPGTIIEDSLLEAKTNNYLVSLFPSGDMKSFGLACVDISTGEFLAAELDREKLKAELFRLGPGELIAPENLAGDRYFAAMCVELAIPVTTVEGWRFSPSEAFSKLTAFFGLKSLKPLGIDDRPLAVSACGGIISYLERTQGSSKPPALGRIRFYSSEESLMLDQTAIRNLELLEGLNSRGRENSLLECMDMTLTPMGGRMLRNWITKPLLKRGEILLRQSAVEYFAEDGLARRGVRDRLKEIADIERILSRLSSFSAGPKELVSLKHSLETLSGISAGLKDQPGIAPAMESIVKLAGEIAPPDRVPDIVRNAISDEPPSLLKDGGVIRDGYMPELDELRTVNRESKKLISGMEQEERRKTGINSLKIGYTSVFGYYIEVSKPNLHLISGDYIRKQTVTNGERFITPRLKELEEKILNAQEKITKLEEAAYKGVCGEITGFTGQIHACALAAAKLDIFASFAEAAALRGYVKPEIEESFDLELKDARHPVVERKIKSGSFVANDTFLNGDSEQIMLLTGPNMSGKSTYLRQVALIVIMAQAGSFVPCSKARVGIIDRIFTRIGAGDNLSGGESTFMVEMHETANILSQHTARSLIILDEVGRGTSTYDGISIAWAAVEYLSKARNKSGKGPKVLFATHYFELTELEGKLPGVKNYNVAVKEWQGEVVFMHKILAGAADRSYGIHVAKLAGLPHEVIEKAYGILSSLEHKPVSGTPVAENGQFDFFSLPSPNILVELKALDLDSLTPLEALKLLAKWKKEVSDDPGSGENK